MSGVYLCGIVDGSVKKSGPEEYEFGYSCQTAEDYQSFSKKEDKGNSSLKIIGGKEIIFDGAHYVRCQQNE